ncbi:MBL fold metallo-hydrolase [Patescibacteria group bacterium]|nr:MBL fold metallo-hydrolase [Patescibacteria group bacterium]
MKKLNPVKISFLGGVEEVTGSNYLLECSPDARSGRATRLLVDCGLFQGSKINEDKNYEPFSFDPKSINVLIITHAHLDHIGRVPKLAKEGFSGKIYSTLPTRDLAKLMLIDSMGVLEKESRRNKKKLIYQEKDVEKAMNQWEAKDYLQEFQVGDFKIKLREAGHILGSAMIEVVYKNKKIVFTGDLGNPLTPLLRDPEPVVDADYLVIESTYGDREHEDAKKTVLKLERVIEDTIKKGGVLMIPAFSLERTQKLLFEINNLVEHGRIPRVPIFLDSPLSIKATGIYKNYQNYFNEEAKDIIRSGDDLFKFPGLKMTLTTEESRAINDVPAPKIIIAGSGMSNGGRIIHHERRYLSDSRNTLLIVSFQAAGSLGRQLEEGAKAVNILGDIIPVSARIENIRGFSCHPDTNELYEFVKHTADTVKKVFVVQGEPKASLFFTQRLRDCLGVDAVVPKLGDLYQLDV